MAGMAAAAGRPHPGKTDSMPKDPKTDLPTFIYDFFLKKGKHDIARAILSSDLGVKVRDRAKTSPGNREVNGVDGSIDLDSRDGLPAPDIQEQLDGSLLQDWCAPRGAGQSSQYLQHSQAQKAQRQQMVMMNNGFMGNTMRNIMAASALPNGMSNGLNPNELRRGAMMNNTNRSIPPIQNMRGQNPLGQTQMQREGSDTDRPQSPMSGDNAPSPKRPRTDSGPAGAQGGRGPMPVGPGQATNVLPNGMDQNMPFNGMAGGPARNVQPFAGAFPGRFGIGGDGFAKGIGAGGAMGGSPMLAHGGDFQLAPELMNNGHFGRNIQGNSQNQQGGALADYQMQLMLLEQQNKKRLLMARQEQEMGTGAMQPVPHAMMPQPPFPPGMSSPRGSRNGNSPSPNEMRRGTPNMAQASPRPDGSMPVTRGSPAPGNMDPSQMPPNMPPHLLSQMNRMPEGMMVPGAVRPSGANGFNGAAGPITQQQQMEMLGRGRGAPQASPGNWAHQGPQVPGQNAAQMPQQQQQQNETQQKPNMPPPSAPPSGQNNGRTNPSSPSQQAAPPTPSQNKNSNQKAKKDAKETKKKTQKKATNSTTGPTPSSEAEHPPTPTPRTPTTPTAHGNPFGRAANAPQGNAGSHSQTTSQATGTMPLQQETNGPGAPFGSLESQEFGELGGMSFTDPTAVENSDVIEGFDFDSFLHFDGGTNGAQPMDFDNYLGMDGVEMGTNEN